MSSSNRVTTARYHFVIIDFYLEPFPPPCYPTSSRSFTMRRRFLEEGWKVITGRAQVETSLPAVFESFLPFRSVWKGSTRMGSRKSGEKSRGAWNRGALSCRVMTARQRDALCSRRSRNSTRGTARGRGKKTERKRKRDRERNRRKKRKKRKKKQLPSFIFLRTKRKRVPGSSSSTERSQKK